MNEPNSHGNDMSSEGLCPTPDYIYPLDGADLDRERLFNDVYEYALDNRQRDLIAEQRTRLDSGELTGEDERLARLAFGYEFGRVFEVVDNSISVAIDDSADESRPHYAIRDLIGVTSAPTSFSWSSHENGAGTPLLAEEAEQITLAEELRGLGLAGEEFDIDQAMQLLVFNIARAHIDQVRSQAGDKKLWDVKKLAGLYQIAIACRKVLEATGVEVGLDPIVDSLSLDHPADQPDEIQRN